VAIYDTCSAGTCSVRIDIPAPRQYSTKTESDSVNSKNLDVEWNFIIVLTLLSRYRYVL
jgi:hypothetical protein